MSNSHSPENPQDKRKLPPILSKEELKTTWQRNVDELRRIEQVRELTDEENMMLFLATVFLQS